MLLNTQKIVDIVPQLNTLLGQLNRYRNEVERSKKVGTNINTGEILAELQAVETEDVIDVIPQINLLLQQVAKYHTRTYPAIGKEGSQFKEDKILGKLLPGYSGAYVDFGASDPVECSNTWIFYERGWRGLLVEPLFWCWPAILQRRPGDYLSGTAIRNYTGVTAMHVQGSVSSVVPGWHIEQQSELLVPCDTATNVLNHFPKIRDSCRLCSIDVEGAEPEVLGSIDWKVFKPEVMVIEYRLHDPEKFGPDISDRWLPLISDYYQEREMTDLNKIFTRK